VECDTPIFKKPARRIQKSPDGAIAVTFKCNLCEEPAGTFAIIPKGVAKPYEVGPPGFQGDIDDDSKVRLQLDYPGVFSKRVFRSRAIAAARKAIEQNDAMPLYEYNDELVPLFCVECRAWYCRDHWEFDIKIIPDGGPYYEEWHWAVCPEKHKRLLFERSR
jgi:hypothetical protein